ncbi:hypothetical protein [Arcticibacter tournemirensis]|uniref:Uncharacterized protein n=1 Tax=Arcticibacter tournemirensis TaxID=699437 RepID=A0A4Q0M4G9_9SPHI|nr:hypothetical protein [Arcticibacter tournemirensis]RXF67850.1 hypothetical protein EKH83_17520 [Arcticibacter tournemirensis]
MIRKDFIEAEIQKLALVLARILGLKNEGNVDDATELAYQTLSDNFGLDATCLHTATSEEFQEDLKNRKYSAEKLDMLAQILFESAYPFQETEETFAILNKTAAVFNLLETEYHQQSLENIARREQIEKFLNNRQYE